jgi:hypothetical protein
MCTRPRNNSWASWAMSVSTFLLQVTGPTKTWRILESLAARWARLAAHCRCESIRDCQFSFSFESRSRRWKGRLNPQPSNATGFFHPFQTQTPVLALFCFFWGSKGFPIFWNATTKQYLRPATPEDLDGFQCAESLLLRFRRVPFTRNRTWLYPGNLELGMTYCGMVKSPAHYVM